MTSVADAILEHKSRSDAIDKQIAKLESEKSNVNDVIHQLQEVETLQKELEEKKKSLSGVLGKRKSIPPPRKHKKSRWDQKPKEDKTHAKTSRWDQQPEGATVGYLAKPKNGLQKVLFVCLKQMVTDDKIVNLEKVSLRSINKIIAQKSIVKYRCNRKMLEDLYNQNFITSNDGLEDYIVVRKLKEDKSSKEYRILYNPKD